MNLEEARNISAPTSYKTKAIGVGGVVVFFTMLFSWNICIYEVDVGYYAVTQNRFTGAFDAWMTPGKRFAPHLKVFYYQISGTFTFDNSQSNEGGDGSNSVHVRYLDGGRGHVPGNVRWEMPNDKAKLIRLHQLYRSQQNFLAKTMREQVHEAVNISAQLMTSTESYTSGKADYMRYAQDQVNNGVYILEAVTAIDTLGDVTREVRKNVIKKDPTAPDGLARKPNPLKENGVRLSLFVVAEPDYEEGIQNQISQRRTRLMEKVISESRAKLAIEQKRAIEAQGEATLVSRRYEQEVKNISEIVLAELVADTSRIAAETRREFASVKREAQEIAGDTEQLLGTGQANVKRLLQNADSNLDIRLSAYVQGHRLRAEAFKNGKRPVSEIIMSGSNGNSGGQILEIMGINAAKQLTTTASSATP